MEKLLHDANQQRVRMEECANDELRVLTNDVRSEVMKNELELRTNITEANQKKQLQKITNVGVKKLIKKYESKYLIFNDARVIEIKDIQNEIQSLRELMRTVKNQYINKKQIHLYNEYTNDNTNDNNNINNQLDLVLNHSTLLKLSQHMNSLPPQPPSTSIDTRHNTNNNGNDICI